MFHNALYQLTIEIHNVLRKVAKLMTWVYGITCVIYAIDINLNNLSYWTMKSPALRFVAFYSFAKFSYLIRNYLLRKIANRARLANMGR